MTHSNSSSGPRSRGTDPRVSATEASSGGRTPESLALPGSPDRGSPDRPASEPAPSGSASSGTRGGSALGGAIAAEGAALDPSEAPQPSAPAPFRVVLDAAGVQRAATRLAHEILERNGGLDSVAVVAIAAGGIPVARLILDKLEQITGQRLPLGELDVTLYRDDVVGRGKRPVPHRTRMLPTVAAMRVVLIDDVMFTGRTVRAAMDAVIDFGRPEGIQVACLVDRGHRELPIHVDFVGKNIPTQRAEQVSVVEISPNTFEVRVA